MAFGTTDRVEAPAWRSQAPRAANTARAADPARPRFGEALAKADAPRAETRTAPGPDRAGSPDRGASDRRETAGRDRTEAARDNSATARDRPDAVGKPRKDTSPAEDGTGTTVRSEAAKGEAAKGEAASDPASKPGSPDEAARASELQTPAGEPSVTPAAPIPDTPVAPTPVAPLPPSMIPVPGTTPGQTPATGQREDAALAPGAIPTGTPRAGATAAIPATPVAVADAEGGQADGTAGVGTKDVLAALAGDGQSGAPSPDPTGAGPSIPAQAAPPSAASDTGPVQGAAPAPPAVPIGQVPMTIGLRSLAGSSEFQIRLDPAELGRIDVKLEIDKAKGTVATHLTVERPDTLALLQRDAGQLQQALTQAGFDPGAGGVSLSLRGDGGHQAGGQGGQPGGGPPTPPWGADRADPHPEAVPVLRLRGYGGLDIRI